jgi:hypothetical protein
MELSRPARYALAVLTVWLLPWGVGWVMLALSRVPPESQPPIFRGLSLVANGLLAVGLLAFYITYLLRTDRVPAKTKARWLAALVFLNVLAMPLFCSRFVLRDPSKTNARPRPEIKELSRRAKVLLGLWTAAPYLAFGAFAAIGAPDSLTPVVLSVALASYLALTLFYGVFGYVSGRVPAKHIHAWVWLLMMPGGRIAFYVAHVWPDVAGIGRRRKAAADLIRWRPAKGLKVPLGVAIALCALGFLVSLCILALVLVSGYDTSGALGRAFAWLLPGSMLLGIALAAFCATCICLWDIVPRDEVGQWLERFLFPVPNIEDLLRFYFNYVLRNAAKQAGSE